MKARDAIIYWTPKWITQPYPQCEEAGQVLVCEFPDEDATKGKNRPRFSEGAKWAHWRNGSRKHIDLMMFIAFNTLVVRDGIDPQEAHRQFLKIEEYALLISPDMEGAKHPQEVEP